MITRKNQVDAVARVAGITTDQARKALDAVGGLVMAGLVDEGKRFVLSGVGTFHTQERSPRRVRHPKTGAMMELPATTVVRFKPAKELRESVDSRWT